MESRGSLTVHLRPPLFFSTFRTPVSKLLRTSLAFNLERVYNRCAAEAEGPYPASAEKNLASIICGSGWCNVVSVSYLRGEVAEDPDKVKIKFIEPLLFSMLFELRHRQAFFASRQRCHDGWHTILGGV